MAGKEPYGDVTYADPGYQKDGNASQYSSADLARVKAAIYRAAKRMGIDAYGSVGR